MPIEFSSSSCCGPSSLNYEQSLEASRARELQNVGQVNAKPNTVEQTLEANLEANNERQNNSSNNGRVDFNADVIAQLDQRNNQNQQPASNQQQSFGQTQYDQPPPQNRRAIQAYQSLENEQQKQDVQQLVGVDIFA